MNDVITIERLKHYFSVTERALAMAKSSEQRVDLGVRNDFVDMIERYVSDAHHFEGSGEIVHAFAALNYAHGWLDAAARIGIFDVHDSTLFTVDNRDVKK